MRDDVRDCRRPCRRGRRRSRLELGFLLCGRRRSRGRGRARRGRRRWQRRARGGQRRRLFVLAIPLERRLPRHERVTLLARRRKSFDVVRCTFVLRAMTADAQIGRAVEHRRIAAMTRKALLLAVRAAQRKRMIEVRRVPGFLRVTRSARRGFLADVMARAAIVAHVATDARGRDTGLDVRMRLRTRDERGTARRCERDREHGCGEAKRPAHLKTSPRGNACRGARKSDGASPRARAVRRRTRRPLRSDATRRLRRASHPNWETPRACACASR